jgi:DegV family protein with EDD domain
MSIAIVTDSTADIPKEVVAKYSITVIPAILVINGRSMEDGKGISRKEFYELLPSMTTAPTTATPSIGTFQDTYVALLKSGYESIISVHVASQLSGIFSTAQAAASNFDGRVVVIDSGQLSLGLGYQVITACESIQAGSSLREVISDIKSVRDRVRVIAMLDTLEYVRRSGRVSWARARIGSLLSIKPFLEVKNGKVFNLGQTRTRNKGITHLIDLCYKTGKIEKLAILHTNAEIDAQRIRNEIDTDFSEPPLIINVTTIVGTHVGPNGLGFAAVVSSLNA